MLLQMVLNCIYIYMYTHTHTHILYPFIFSGHLGFHVLAIVNSAVMNTGVQMLVLSGYMPRNGIAGSYGYS